MKKILKWGLVVIIGIIVIGALIGSGSEDSVNTSSESNQVSTESQSSEVEVQPEVMTVDSSEFVAEFDKNQLAAEEKYEGKWIETTGYIENISEDITGSPFLSIKPTAEEVYFGTSIQCFFNDTSQLTSLENGQEVTVKGQVNTQVANILVKDCSVVSE